MKFVAAFEKTAFVGIGVPVLTSENGRHNINVGVPHILGYSYRLTDAPVSPSIGIGLTGPQLGISFGGGGKKEKGEKKAKREKKEK